MLFVDTSVLIPFFSGKNNPGTERLVQAEKDLETIAIPIICCQELLQGAINEAHWKKLLSILSTQNVVSLLDPFSSSVSAARIYYDCRKKGITIRSTIDCLIAQIVLENNGVLLHMDKDFEQIAKVRSLRLITS